MIRSLFPMLLSILCLMLVSGPAFAGTDRSYVAGHFFLELAGDSAGMLKQITDDPLVAATLGKKHQKSVKHLMANPITKNFILIGDARAKALAKKKPLPGFASINGAKEQTYDEVIAWSEESLELIETMKDSIKDELDSMSEMNEMEALRMQEAMDRLAKVESQISNLLKKASETQQSIIDNLK